MKSKQEAVSAATNHEGNNDAGIYEESDSASSPLAKSRFYGVGGITTTSKAKVSKEGMLFRQVNSSKRERAGWTVGDDGTALEEDHDRLDSRSISISSDEDKDTAVKRMLLKFKRRRQKKKKKVAKKKAAKKKVPDKPVKKRAQDLPRLMEIKTGR